MLLSSSNHGQNFVFGFHFHTSVDFATRVKKKRQTYAIPFLSQKLLETIALRHAQTKIIINWIKDPVTSLLKFMLQAILSVEKETELKQSKKKPDTFSEHITRWKSKDNRCRAEG